MYSILALTQANSEERNRVHWVKVLAVEQQPSMGGEQERLWSRGSLLWMLFEKVKDRTPWVRELAVQTGRPEPLQHAFASVHLYSQCWKDRQDAGDLVGRKCSTRWAGGSVRNAVSTRGAHQQRKTFATDWHQTSHQSCCTVGAGGV